MLLNLMDIIAYVRRTLMIPNVNLIVNVVIQILVGIMVYRSVRSANRKSHLFFVGTCNQTANGTIICTCGEGWYGEYCQTRINNCTGVTCYNNGVCRPLHMDYKCECLGNSFSGRHCEIVSTKMKMYQIVSKSVSYVAIIALCITGTFIVIMDILKYCFGIDPVEEERERIRREKRAKKRKPVRKRFIYVN